MIARFIRSKGYTDSTELIIYAPYLFYKFYLFESIKLCLKCTGDKLVVTLFR